nr:TetR family transcriptional regulator [Deinococcus aestuarii]
MEAAVAEFSHYGIAGARVDRIAAASASNKAMIYTYFGSKEGLLEAVGEWLVAWHLQEVPLDTQDLPEYAARVFDRYQAHPELMRLVNWDRLERGGGGEKASRLAETVQAKVEAIAQAQREGRLGTHFPAPVLLELLLALVELPTCVADLRDEEARAARRQAIKDAVARLIER